MTPNTRLAPTDMTAMEKNRSTAADGRRGPAIGPSVRNVLTWLGLYLLLALFPLVIALIGETPAARGFWIDFGIGLGFVALAMLALQFVLTARFRRIASPFGLDTLLHFHRQAGLAAFVFALAHPVVLILAFRPFWHFLDPRALFVRAFALWTLLIALVLLIVTTLRRRQWGIAYQWWRAGHGLLAVLVLFIGTVHVIQVDFYGAVMWKKLAWVALSAAAFGMFFYSRIVKPWQMRKQPYRVVGVVPERGDSYTLTLEPVGHEGMAFTAGQFAWLTLGSTPFSIDAHPFSFVGSAVDRRRTSFTIKKLGDFTATIDAVKPGTTAFLEGPYGLFTFPDGATAAVFIAGGVGITPMMSMLRTMRDTGDRRPVQLVYAVKTWEDATFREELAELEGALNLTATIVVEKPHEGWEGEAGYLTPALLARRVPPDEPGTAWLVCGPEPMMDVVEPWLQRHGVPLRRINSERFNIA